MREEKKTVSIRMPLTLIKKLTERATRERRTLTAEIIIQLEKRGDN